MKILKHLIILLLFVSFYSFAQTTKIKIKKEEPKKDKPVVAEYYHNGSIDLYYGYRVYHKSYYNQINSLDKKIDPNLPLQFIGIGVSGYNHTVNMRSRIYDQINYYKIIPTRVMIEDSLNTKISGYVIGCGFGYGIGNAKKTLSLSGYIGFNTGRTTLSKNEYISQKNQFFSPKIMIQPKVIIKHIAISVIFEAEYDITNPGWNRPVFERKDPYLLKPFHQNCVTGLVSIGYKFH